MTPKSKKRLDPAVIIDAAIKLVEEQGLAELSARKLAGSLHCEAMSLYYHFSNMDALHDSIVDRLLSTLDFLIDPGQSPRERLRKSCRSYLMMAVRFPRCFPLAATRLWRTPSAMLAAQGLLAIFAAAGHPAPLALAKMRAIGAYLNGAGLALAAWQVSNGAAHPAVIAALPEQEPSALDRDAVLRDLMAGLDSLIDALL